MGLEPQRQQKTKAHLQPGLQLLILLLEPLEFPLALGLDVLEARHAVDDGQDLALEPRLLRLERGALALLQRALLSDLGGELGHALKLAACRGRAFRQCGQVWMAACFAWCIGVCHFAHSTSLASKFCSKYLVKNAIESTLVNLDDLLRDARRQRTGVPGLCLSRRYFRISTRAVFA